LRSDCADGNSKPQVVTDSADHEISESSSHNETTNWPVPLPSRFHYYDLDGDGVLTLKELAKVTGTSRKDARLPFEAADTDGDKRITPQEFDHAPWLFGELPLLAHPSPDLSHSANHTLSESRRRPGRRGHRRGKKKLRRQHQKKLKKKLASGTKAKNHKSANSGT